MKKKDFIDRWPPWKLNKTGKILLVVFAVFCLVTTVDQVFLDYQYNYYVESSFDLSDKASKLDLKLDYLTQYKQAVLENGLDEGQSTVFFQTKETDLSENFKVLQSLETRLIEINHMKIDSWEYQKAIEQITEDEYCWFHTTVFRQGFYLKNWRVWLALFPSYVYNRCRGYDD